MDIFDPIRQRYATAAALLINSSGNPELLTLDQQAAALLGAFPLESLAGKMAQTNAVERLTELEE